MLIEILAMIRIVAEVWLISEIGRNSHWSVTFALAFMAVRFEVEDWPEQLNADKEDRC